MRHWLLGLALIGGASTVAHAAETALVEQFLSDGNLARGEHALRAALEASPQHDETRFGLGLLQFVRGVERLGQALYEYGCQAEHSSLPFVRLPVPENPDPTPVTAFAFRRTLEAFYHDVAAADATLAGVADDRVSLRLRLARVQFDLTGDGKTPMRLVALLQKLSGRELKLPPGNPELLVALDRGDVAWLRTYCHLLMALVDLQLAFDFDEAFDLTSDQLFARPKQPFQGTPEERNSRLSQAAGALAVREPVRLGRARRHMVQMCEFSRETWRFIQAETDNDHEWAPNPRQQGLLGAAVRAETIQTWLRMIDEVDALFSGRKVIPKVFVQFVSPSAPAGLNLQTVLDDPPAQFDWKRLRTQAPQDKYLDGALPDLDVGAFLQALLVFQNSSRATFLFWFQ